MGMAIESTVNTMDSASKCSISQTPPISPNFLLQYCDLAKSTGRQQSINLKIHQQRNATSVSSQYLLRTESVSMSMEILRRRYGDTSMVFQQSILHIISLLNKGTPFHRALWRTFYTKTF